MDSGKRERGEGEPNKGSEFFASLRLAPMDHLDSKDKWECTTCHRKSKYYCYDCMVPVGDRTRTPVVELPFALDIIHHPSEKRSKSSAVQAVIVSPQATMYDSPNVPEYDPAETVLLFPSADAVDVSAHPDLSRVKRVVVVDSQWQRTGGIVSHPNLARLPCVIINSRNTFFWRYQPDGMGDQMLATIEAIYYMCKDFHNASQPNVPYDGRFDNLLFFFAHQYKLIQGVYRESGGTVRKKPNFIEGNEKK